VADPAGLHRHPDLALAGLGEVTLDQLEVGPGRRHLHSTHVVAPRLGIDAGSGVADRVPADGAGDAPSSGAPTVAITTRRRNRRVG
jgi:hypothetical protein